MIRSPVKRDISQSIAAGGTFDAFTDWDYETPDSPCMIEVLERATAVGLLSTIKAAGDTLKQESQVQAGGTAGTTPARLTTEPVTGRAPAFQKIRAFYRNPTGGAITIDLLVILTPLGGGGGGGGGVRRAPPRRRRRK
jgi:hypothetical protein